MKPTKLKINNGIIKKVNKSKIDSGFAVFIEVIGWIIIITGIVVGFLNGKNSVDPYSQTKFNIIIAISDWITFFVNGAILIGLGSALSCLHIMAYSQYEYHIDTPLEGEIIIDGELPVEIKNNTNQENN